MATLQTYYEKFKHNIKLTRESDEYKKVREKDDLVTPKVKTALTDAGYKVEDDFLQGSLKMHTGIKPLDGDYDIDRAIVLCGTSVDDNPIPPKKVVKQTLKDHGFYSPVIKNPCVTADYISDNIHIDYPIYRKEYYGDLELGIGKECSGEDHRYWDESDPKGLIDWVADSQFHQDGFFARELTAQEKDQYRRLVRYLKRWRDESFTSESERKKVFSIALTVMLKESFKPSIDTNNGKVDDHLAIKDTLDTILNKQNYFIDEGDEQYSISVYLPVTPTDRDIFQESSQTIGTKLRKKFINLLGALEEVDQLDDLHAQTQILNKYFGRDFEIHPKDNGNNSKNANNKSAALVGISTGAA